MVDDHPRVAILLLMFGIIVHLLAKISSCAPILGPDVLFKEIDKNGDTFLDIDELRNWFVELFMNKIVEFAPVDKMISPIDLGHNGELDEAELKFIFDRKPSTRKATESLDANHDGKLDKLELRKMVEGMLPKVVQNMITRKPLAREIKKSYQNKLLGKGIDPAWYDMNKDGQMGQFELEMAKLVMQVLELFDIDGDHKVSAKEYGDSRKQRNLTGIIMDLEAEMQISADNFQIPPTIF